MGAWKRTSARRRCEICGHGGWCSFSADGAVVVCQYAHDQEVPGFKIIKSCAETTGGTVYSLVGVAGTLPSLSPAELELQRREDEKKRKAEISRAVGWWNEGVEDHPRAAGYIEARGVPVAMLPGRALPGVIRCTAERTDWTQDEQGTWVQTEGPVLVAAVAGADGQVRGVQRIFLDPIEHAKRKGNAKFALGSLKGGAVRLSTEMGEGTLILTEGVETGLAVLAAVSEGSRPRAGVWACVSTSGLKAVEIPGDLARIGGPLRRIIIAGDHDEAKEHLGGKRPGEEAANAAAARLRKLHPHIAVGVALPTALEAPADWLDVYQLDGAAMADTILGCVALPEEGAAVAWSGDGKPPKELRLPGPHLDRAWLFLRELFPPTDQTRGGWQLREWDDDWWRFDAGHYVVMPARAMRAEAFKWLSKFYVCRKIKVDGEEKETWAPMNATEKEVNLLLVAVGSIVHVHAVDGMPCWLPGDVDLGGDCVYFGRRVWRSSMTAEEAEEGGRPEPRMLVPLRNGLVDVRAWLDRKGLLHEHTELLLSETLLPYALDPRVLERVADDDEALEREIERLCPVWLEFIASATGGDDDMAGALAMLMGLCLTPDMTFEIIALLTGPAGGGKSTFLAGVFATVGSQQVAISDLNLITRPFNLYPLVGKLVCAMTDADVGRMADAGGAAETVKKISGGDPMFIDRKNREPLKDARLFCKILMATNRLPRLPDHSGGLTRRFRVFPFDETFVGRERREFKDERVLRRECPGRLLWALRGLRQLHARKAFPQPMRGVQLLDEYTADMDPVGTFVAECLDVSEEIRESFEYTGDLFRAWVKWANAGGRHVQNDGWFGTQLRAACPKLVRKQKTEGEGGRRRWGYEGVRILEHARASEASAEATIPFPPV